jgi:predicted nucleic-acid-binding Zn-ribbon protein
MNPLWKCLRCGGDDRYEIEELLLADDGSANGVNPLTLTAHDGETGAAGLTGAAKTARAVVRAAAKVCVSCGYAELYAKDLPVLARLAQEGNGGVLRRRG